MLTRAVRKGEHCRGTLPTVPAGLSSLSHCSEEYFSLPCDIYGFTPLAQGYTDSKGKRGEGKAVLNYLLANGAIRSSCSLKHMNTEAN